MRKGPSDAFVTKLSSAGNALVYSTYLGGTVFDRGLDIAMDGNGNAYLTGVTNSNDFPTKSPFQAFLGGDINGFVTKLNAAGGLSYSTYLGGSQGDDADGIALDADGNAYITGATYSTNFPTTPGAFDITYNGIADVYVVKLNPAGSSLVYGTYLGGSYSEFGLAIAVDAAGNAYVSGNTNSLDFPTVAAYDSTKNTDGESDDVFVSKLDSSGNFLVFSTYLGGSYDDYFWDIDLDSSGWVYVTGSTLSTDFPTTPDAIQPGPWFGNYDGFLTMLNPAGDSLAYSTYLGGALADQSTSIAVGKNCNGDVYLTGETYSTNFPLKNTIQSYKGLGDAFVMKFTPGIAPAIPTDQWTPKGPAPILFGQTPGNMPVSGRISAIATHTDPNIIYVGAASGGVWKTTNAGVTWTPLTSNLPLIPEDRRTLVIGAIALAPSNPDVIYAGTGEAVNTVDAYYGRGVLKSIDAGATWTLVGNAEFDRKSIARLVVHPTNPNIVYAAVANGTNGVDYDNGIWKSIDGGTTWNKTTTTTLAPYSDLVMHPLNPNLLYAAAGDRHGSSENGLYRSRNGGQTWTAVGNFPMGIGNGRINLALAPSSPNIMYAAVVDPSTFTLKNLYKTTTSGRIWNALPGVPNYLGTQGFYNSALIVDPNDDDIVYAGGQLDIIRSDDGGATWEYLNQDENGNGPHADHQIFAFDANGDLLDGNDGGMWRLDIDVGADEWVDLNTNLQITQFNGIAMHPYDLDIAYGGAQDNGTNKTWLGDVWEQIGAGDGGFVRVDCVNPDTVYHTFFYTEGAGTGFFQRSDDAGETWTAKVNGLDLTDKGNFYIPYVMDPSNPKRLLLGTNTLYETTDRGDNWTPIHEFGDTKIDSIEVATSKPQTIYVTEGGEIYRTDTNGLPWHSVGNGLPGDHYRDLLVDPTDHLTVYVVRDRFDDVNKTGQVFRSTDGGANWSNITSNLPPVPANALALDPRTNPDTLYVGTDVGVYVSTNLGVSWQVFKTGLPPVMVRELELNQQLNILAAGTFGRGLWEIGIEYPPPPTPIPPPGDDRPSLDVANPSPAGAVFVVADFAPLSRPVRPSDTPMWRHTDVVIPASTMTASKPNRIGHVTTMTVVATVPEVEWDLFAADKV